MRYPREILMLAIAAPLAFACGDRPATDETATLAPPPGAVATDLSPAIPDPLTDEVGGEYDLRFLDTMTAHHRQAVEMLQMTADRATNPGLKEAAQNELQAHRRDVGELERLREQRFSGIRPAQDMTLPGATSMGAMDLTSMASMEGGAFDRHMADMLIDHYEGAIAMAQDAVQSATGDDVRRKAQEILDRHRRELEELEALRSGLG